MLSKVWEKMIRPVMFSLGAETAHDLGIAALKAGAGAFVSGKCEPFDFGPIERFGLKFDSPIGLAAGFDKNCVVVEPLAKLGFGFVEVGTVTLEPQPGNPKPRLFRLPGDKALINRLGFNNDGVVAVSERLRTLKKTCVVGVNIGKNKDVPVEAATENYIKCLELIHPYADYVAVNVSSPNTPNLRELQKAENLEELLSSLQKRNRELGQRPLLVKIAPDLTVGEIEAIADIAIRHQLEGLIATNTTVSRDGLHSANVNEIGAGGLSGRPLRERSTDVIRTVYRYTGGKLPIIGVGGIFDAQDAFDKIAAGASLVQAYTGFVYAGPGFANSIKRGLAAILSQRGFKHLDDAVGSDSK
ncbi:MAG: quinone-dependent dihydroorotate dehydrogenase [Pyrinomonadaceae bacterium]|nr:quinone-dependent dihydroorotate dehydrogenase [Pyrinomonadaceae bacterium]